MSKRLIDEEILADYLDQLISDCIDNGDRKTAYTVGKVWDRIDELYAAADNEDEVKDDVNDWQPTCKPAEVDEKTEFIRELQYMLSVMLDSLYPIMYNAVYDATKDINKNK